jgi:hypothetical protein
VRKIISLLVFLPLCAVLPMGCAMVPPVAIADTRFQVGGVIYSDDFRHGLAQWTPELEKAGRVDAHDGQLEIDVPAGCTVWFNTKLIGPVLIEYDATVIKAGGPNDRVSDLNCFWMAQDARSPDGVLAIKRSGKFEDYNQLLCYYVGQGGNTNTTTRFRRYIGSPTTRPLLPEHDLSSAQYLLMPNVKQHITLIACGSLIEYFRDGQRIFEYTDPAPYRHGWFALRTTFNHMIIENFDVRTISPGVRPIGRPMFNLSRHPTSMNY